MAELYRGASSPHFRHRQQSGNVVLVKDEVGTAKRGVHELSPEERTFGIRQGGDADGLGAKEAFTWVQHEPSLPRRSRAPNFTRLNKAAVRARATSPRQLAAFRASHEDLASPASPARASRPARSPNAIPSDVVPGFAYGRKSRPPTPMTSVMANEYGNMQEMAIEDRYKKYEAEKARASGPLRFKMTKAAGSYRRQPEAPPTDPSQLWKMKRFQNVTSRVEQPNGSPASMRKSTSAPNVRTKATAEFGCEEAGHVATASFGRDDDEETIDAGDTETDSEEEVETASEDDRWRERYASGLPLGNVSFADDGWSVAANEPATEAESSPYERRLVEAGDSAEDTADARLAGVTSPSSPSKRWSYVSAYLTARCAQHDELEHVSLRLAEAVRSRFPDRVVKLREIMLENPRQGLREKRQRYVAWGQGALRGRVTAPAGAGAEAASTRLCSLVVSLMVRHGSAADLEATIASVLDHVQSRFEPGALQVRELVPLMPSLVPSRPATHEEAQPSSLRGAGRCSSTRSNCRPATAAAWAPEAAEAAPPLPRRHAVRDEALGRRAAAAAREAREPRREAREERRAGRADEDAWSHPRRPALPSPKERRPAT